MRNDRDAFLAEGRVAAGVIAVIMRVDQVLDRLIADFRNRRFQLVVHRRELRIHHDDAVRADGDRDVAACALEHVGVLAEIGRLHFDLGKVLLLCRVHIRRDQRHAGGGECPCQISHRFLLLVLVAR